MKNKPPFPPFLGLAIGVCAVSTASTFIRLAQGEVHPLAIAVWRLGIGGSVFCAAAVFSKKSSRRVLTAQERLFITASGILLAVHFSTWIISLSLTSVTASVVIVTLYPVFTALGSRLFFREPLTCGVWIGIWTAFFGSAVISVSDIRTGGHRFSGDLLALAGAVSVAGYFLIGKQMRKRVGLVTYAAYTYSTAAAVSAAAALLFRIPLAGYSTSAWLWILLIALIPQITGHTFLNWSLKYMSATAVTLPVLTEPLISVLLAWAVLKEPPPAEAAAGAVCVLAGMYIALSRVNKKRLGISVLPDK